MSGAALPPCQPTTSGLSRCTTGLTPAHVELIRLLAQIAVENYLRETQPVIGAHK